MASVNVDSMIVRNSKEFLANPIGEEVVVMDMKKGNYIGLNSVGARIWTLLETPQAVKDIVAVLMQEYSVDEATCLEHTKEYLDKMIEQGLIQVAG